MYVGVVNCTVLLRAVQAKNDQLCRICIYPWECPARWFGLGCTAEYAADKAQISDEIRTNCATWGVRWDVCRRLKYEKQLKK